MAGVKISALPAVSSALTTDFFPVVQGGVTSKETIAQVQALFGFTTGILSLAAGGTGANLTASNGSLFYSTASSGALLPTINNGVLVTGAGGIPAISTTLPTGLTIADYLPLAGGTMSGNLFLNGNPTVASQAANKAYVDSVAAGFAPATPVDAATTANLVGVYVNGTAGVGATLTITATGTVVLDGVTTLLGRSYLIKNQTTGADNGIYTVTVAGATGVQGVFTRSTSYDTAAQIASTGIVPVTMGTTQASTGWLQTNVVTTIGTDALSFTQFGSAGTVTSVTAGTGLTGGTITSTGTIALSTPVSVANGGTALSSIAQNDILYASAANTYSGLVATDSAVLTTSASGVPTYIALGNEQILVGQTSAAPVARTLTAGSGISITPTTGVLTLAATNSGTVTSVATGAGLSGGTITSTGTIALDTGISLNASAPAGSLAISSVGTITTPNTPGFFAFVTTTSSAVTGDGTAYPIAGFTSSFDNQSNFNATSGVFTAPVAGTYFFSATIVLSSLVAGNTNGFAVMIVGGNGNVIWGNWGNSRSSTGNFSINITQIIKLAANATCLLHIFENGNGSKNVTVTGGINNGTLFQGWLLG